MCAVGTQAVSCLSRTRSFRSTQFLPEMNCNGPLSDAHITEIRAVTSVSFRL